MPPLFCSGDRCHVYEIGFFLGTSGAAELYLVREPSGEPCILKVMAAPGADKQRLRFAQEGVVLAKILHANVVRVFGAGTWGERVWLVIEQFGTETLGDRLRAGGPPPLDDLLGWMQQVCGGLAEAHRQGIVHRNLTPDSVILGPGGLVKLGDFGMAKLPSFGVVTTADQQVGSALYGAPEMFVEKDAATPQADLYGLGVLLYEAITGVHPMGPGPFNPITVVAWHLRERVRPLRERAPWAPTDLAALVHQMLEKDPSRRPASTLAVHDRLRDARVSLRAPLLRQVRNAAPVEHPIDLAPTAPMAATPGGDRTAVLPAPVPLVVTQPPVAPRIVPHPEAPTFQPEAPGEVRVTGEPVESKARRAPPTSRWAPVIGGAVLTLTLAGAASGWTLWSHLTGPAQGAESTLVAVPASAPAPPASPPAPRASPPAPSASAAAPRSPGAGTSKRPAARPVARPPGSTRVKN